VRCREAGASVIHLHVRREDGRRRRTGALFQKALDAIPPPHRRNRADQHRRAVGMTADERRQPSSALRRPMATLNAGR